jgi:hypothetical protein
MNIQARVELSVRIRIAATKNFLNRSIAETSSGSSIASTLPLARAGWLPERKAPGQGGTRARVGSQSIRPQWEARSS